VFLQRFLRAAQVATASEYRYLEHLSRYVLEVSLLDHTLLAYRTSTVAAAALFLSRVLLAKAHKRGAQTRPHIVWTRTMEHYAFHTAAELRLCVRHLHGMLLAAGCKASRTVAIRNKYRSPRRMAVANMYFVPTFPDDVFEQYHGIPVPAELLSHVQM
jgi:Cyclin, C-terminal domain